jgi:hypothetical protein
MFSSPVARRNLLSAFITSGEVPGGIEDTKDRAKSDAK